MRTVVQPGRDGTSCCHHSILLTQRRARPFNTTAAAAATSDLHATDVSGGAGPCSVTRLSSVMFVGESRVKTLKQSDCD